MGTQSYLHLMYRHSPSEWDQLTWTESEPISTGPFPTWNGCQQLLQVLFTTEEQEQILAEARKQVPGVDRRPTTQPHLVDKGFPLLRPNWDFERVEGRDRLRVYCQILMAGLRATARKPTNLAKVNLVRQEPTESPSAFLERLMEAFRQYTPMDPQAEESRAVVLLAFVNQAAPDIRRKLQKIDGLGEQIIQDLLKAAEKLTAKKGGTGKMSALRGTQREEQLREREFPLELEFYMWGKTMTRGVKTRHPSPSPG